MGLIDEMRYHGAIRVVVFNGDPGERHALDYLDGAPSTFVQSDQTVHNLVTNMGRQKMTQLIVGETTAGVGYIGLSTSAITPALTDIALTNEVARLALSIKQSISTYTQRYSAYAATGDFNSTGVVACGLFDTATTGGNMFADGSITLSKTNTQSATIDWRITATT